MSAATEMTLDELAADLEKRGRSLAFIDWTPTMRDCAQLIRSDTLSNFADSHDPDGNPWLPLRRPRPGSKGQDNPLRDRGFLQSAATSGAEVVITGDGLTYRLSATNVLDYAGAHQDGATVHLPERRRRPGQKPFVFRTERGETVFTRRIKATSFDIPQRRFLGFGERLTDRIEDTVAKRAAGVLDPGA